MNESSTSLSSYCINMCTAHNNIGTAKCLSKQLISQFIYFKVQSVEDNYTAEW